MTNVQGVCYEIFITVFEYTVLFFVFIFLIMQYNVKYTYFPVFDCILKTRILFIFLNIYIKSFLLKQILNYKVP